MRERALTSQRVLGYIPERSLRLSRGEHEANSPAVVRTLDADSVAPGLWQVLRGPLSSRISMLCLYDSFLCNLEIANISIRSSFTKERKIHSSLIRGTVMMSLPCMY